MESKFQPKTKKVSCSDFNKRGDQYYASRYGLSLLFGSWTLFNCCIIITAVLFQLDQNGGWRNICFLTFVFNFQDSVDFQLASEKSQQKRRGQGIKKSAKYSFFNLMASQRKYLIFPKTAIDKLFCAAVLVCLDSWLFVVCDVMQEVKVFSWLPNIPTNTNFQVRFFILIRIDFWLFYHINIYLHFGSKLSFQERKYHHI